MIREQMISLLQTSIVFLVLTNVASLAAAVYALRRVGQPAQARPKSAIERNAENLLRRRA